VESHAVNKADKYVFLDIKQAIATPSSSNPTQNINSRNLIPTIGSGCSNILDEPNALHTLARPVTPRISPQLKKSFRLNGCLPASFEVLDTPDHHVVFISLFPYIIKKVTP